MARIILVETFIGGYPKGLDFGIKLGLPNSDGREEFKRYFDSAIEYHSREADRIAEIAHKYEVYIVVGVVECEMTTLFSSVSYL